jgi:hypothetical protein
VRSQAYALFTIVAWPAAAWGAFEVGLRLVSGQLNGIAPTALLTSCAIATIALSRWRRDQLSPAPATDR